MLTKSVVVVFDGCLNWGWRTKKCVLSRHLSGPQQLWCKFCGAAQNGGGLQKKARTGLAHWLTGSTPFKWQTSCSVTWMLQIEQLQSLPGHGIGWEIVATVSKTFRGIIISWSGFSISNPDESWLNLKILLCCKFVASFTLVAGKVRKGEVRCAQICQLGCSGSGLMVPKGGRWVTPTSLLANTTVPIRCSVPPPSWSDKSWRSARKQSLSHHALSLLKYWSGWNSLLNTPSWPQLPRVPRA